MKLSHVFLWVSALSSLLACTPASDQTEPDWQVLFDGSSLAGWDTYLGPRMVPDAEGKSIREQTLQGLNQDTAGVFRIVEVDGAKAVRISGEIWGGISTQQSYENYHLQLQFKWGQKRWFPKAQDRRDSGLLYHGVGEHGAGDGFWLCSQELQIQEQDCGDYWGVAGGSFDVHATLNEDSVYQYDPEGTLHSFNQYSPTGRHCKKFPDAEKPSGEWNTVDLYCFKDTSVHVINGVVTMVLHNSQRWSGESAAEPLTRGKIQLQSESAEVYYREIKLQPIDRIPVLN